MRSPERIPIFLKLVKWDKLLKLFNIFQYDDTIDKVCYEINNNLSYIQEYWEANPDLRITQVLVNTGFIPNKPGSWYYQEEWSLLKAMGINPKEFLTWKSIYDEHNNHLKKPIVRLIKDLETDHLKKILETCLIGPNTEETIKDILKERGAL